MTAAIRLAGDTPFQLGLRIAAASLVLAAAISAAGVAPPIAAGSTETAGLAAP